MFIEVTYTDRSGVDRCRMIPLDGRRRGPRRELERCLFDAVREYEFWLQQGPSVSREGRRQMKAVLFAINAINKELTESGGRERKAKDKLFEAPEDFDRRQLAIRFSRNFPSRNGRVRVVLSS